MNVQPLSRCYDKNLKHLLLWLMDTLRVIDQVFIMPGGGTLMHSKVRSSAACPEPGSGRGTGRLHLADAAGPGCFAVPAGRLKPSWRAAPLRPSPPPGRSADSR